jgi:hypothetical protein
VLFRAVLWGNNDAAVDKALVAIKKSFAYQIKTKKTTTPEKLEALTQAKLKATTKLKDLAM